MALSLNFQRTHYTKCVSHCVLHKKNDFTIVSLTLEKKSDYRYSPMDAPGAGVLKTRKGEKVLDLV